MNIDTDVNPFVAWMIIVAWAIGTAALFVAYRPREREWERVMERGRL